MSFDGRVASVTGAQQGIGRSIAEAMGQAGASVVINWLDDEEAAEEVAAVIREAGADAVTVRGDVATGTADLSHLLIDLRNSPL